jgi:predicted GH43/DUF377 family glycosyl hydrolase
MKPWRKLGQIFEPRVLHPQLETHAANPTVLLMGNGLARVYFSARANDRRASIGWAVFDLERPEFGALEVCSNPVMTPGAPGTFDDSGVSMGCFAVDGGDLRLYYLGWNLGVTVPWRNSIGLAVSRDGGLTFERHSDAPLLDRCHADPFSISYPWVLQRGPDDWLIWYGSNLSWGSGQTQEEMAHLLKVGTSRDGLVWNREGKIALPFKDESEYAMSKPCVLHDGDLYRMWYSFRGAAYRIGYAESPNGIDWTRRDNLAGITVSDSGWDSQTVEYPCVFDALGARWMLYNGNGYGLTGFGLAVMEP